MSLDAAACASGIYTDYLTVIELPNTVDYPPLFAGRYEDYATAGIVTGADNGGGDESIIEAAIEEQTTPELLGVAFMQYWATVALIPQAPNLAVANDATDFEDAFIAAVYASLSLVETVPPFKTLIDNIEAVAKGMTWTVTPPPPLPPFTSGIS